MDRFEAIYKRKSVRKYSFEEIAGETLFQLWELIDSLERLYPDIDLEIQMLVDGAPLQDIMGGIIGSYGKIMAPHYLVVTSEKKEGYLENVGYTVENLVLGMTALGISTCWIGGQVKKDLLRKFMEIKENHIPAMIISFGYAEDPAQQFRLPADKVKRKEVNELVIEGEPGDGWLNILEAVRMAPSAVNSQPWRFAFTDQGVHVYGVKRSILTKWIFSQLNFVDVGIALSHIKVAAEHYGKQVKFERLPGVDQNGHNYVMSVVEE